MKFDMIYDILHYLTSIVTLDATSTEAGRGKDEDLLGDRVDLPHTLVVVHNRHPGLPDPQGNGPG